MPFNKQVENVHILSPGNRELTALMKENRATASYEIPLEILDQISDEPQVLSLPHWHELVEIIYIEEGELLLQLGEKNLLLSSGQVCIINQYGVHSTRAEKRVRGFVIFFLPSLLLNNDKGSADERNLSNLICGAQSLIITQGVAEEYIAAIKNLEAIYENYTKKGNGHTLFARSNLYNFFGLLLANPSLYYEVPNHNYRLQRERMDKISKIIEDRGTETITLADIAKELNISTFRFCHIFKELTGYTFSQYLMRYRLLKAEELLAAGDQPIIEVAMACGFNSVNYFNRVFKEVIGSTPRAYRNKYRMGLKKE